MRIISQKGIPVIIDIPYEKVSVSQQMTDPSKIIAWDVLAADDDIILMAKYSTPEKAEKAMQLLHERYLGICVMHMSSEFDGDGASLNSIGIYKISESGDYAYNLPKGERIFRFPAEDEL